MNKTNVALGVLAALFISACGGDGSTPPTTASKMAPYAGTWVGPCDHHELPSLTISDTGVNDAATYTATSAFYSQVGCTGTIVATRTYTANFSAVHVGSTDASVVLPRFGRCLDQDRLGVPVGGGLPQCADRFGRDPSDQQRCAGMVHCLWRRHLDLLPG